MSWFPGTPSQGAFRSSTKARASRNCPGRALHEIARYDDVIRAGLLKRGMERSHEFRMRPAEVQVRKQRDPHQVASGVPRGTLTVSAFF